MLVNGKATFWNEGGRGHECARGTFGEEKGIPYVAGARGERVVHREVRGTQGGVDEGEEASCSAAARGGEGGVQGGERDTGRC